jgi:hypothetical protein
VIASSKKPHPVLGTWISWLLLALAMPRLPADEPLERPVSSRIAETQLTLRLGPVQGRATVIAIDDDTLTVLTAAHFLAPEDAGKTIQIQGPGDLRGRLGSVARNPNFHPLRSRVTNAPSPAGTLGVDTAIATIEVNVRTTRERRAFAAIRPAELIREPVLRNSGQVLTVHIVDQFGQEHVVRAGNHLNPRCLAWGKRSYDTQRGDSGAGVFVVRETAEGPPAPVLVGSVSQTDDRGAIASLAYRNESWIGRAIVGLPPESK